MVSCSAEVPLYQYTQHGDKQEKLEATVQLEINDLIAITEMWWDESVDCGAASDGYRLFIRDKQERWGRSGMGCPLCKKNQTNDCTEFFEKQ